jgi:hypothetical protein
MKFVKKTIERFWRQTWYPTDNIPIWLDGGLSAMMGFVAAHSIYSSHSPAYYAVVPAFISLDFGIRAIRKYQTYQPE